MDEGSVLHELLYYALIDLREHARERDDRPVFELCDLFHTVVLHMGTVASGEGDYAAVLTDLKQRASERAGCAIWLENHLEMLRRKDEEKDA